MNIRLANKFDVNYFIHIAKKVYDMDFINTTEPVNEEHLNSMFNGILHGNGIALIAESDSNIGIVVGIINENLWYPNMFQLTQILLFVDEDYRNTRAGYLLLKEYNKLAKQLIDDKRINNSIIYAAEPLHDIDFSRFGYKMAEKIWQLEI